MKKLLLATAIAALSVSAANAAPTVYGKAFVTTDYVSIDNGNEDDSTLEINSNISRLGFKGSEAITANTDLIYQLEYGLNIDGESRLLQSRDTFLGVKNKDFGEFRLGRNYSVIDYVNNVTRAKGFWDNLGPGSADFGNGDIIEALNLTDGNRVNNSIVWKAPKYNDLPLELALMYGADEEFANDETSEGYGASLLFNPGTGFTAGVAYSSDLNVQGDILRGTATVDLGKYVTYPVTLGALYQTTDFDFSDEKEKGFVISGEMGLNNFAKPAAVYVQYNNTSNLDGFNNADSDQIVVGAKYMFKPNMIAHAYIGQNSADLDNVLVRDDQGVAIAIGDVDVFAVGAGLEYNF